MYNVSMQKIKLISLDFDGTTLNKKAELTPHTKEVLRRLHDEKGIIIYPNTGRGTEVLEPLARKLDFIDYYSGLNGGMILQKGKIVRDTPFEKEAAQRVFDALEEEGFTFIFVLDGFYFDKNGISPRSFESITAPFQQDVDRQIKEKGLRRFIRETDRKVYKIVATFFDQDDMALAKKRVLEKMKSVDGIICQASLVFNVEINPSLCSKGTSVEFVQERYGLKREEILCIGDNDNDIEMMLEGCETVAMKNGTEGLKQKTKYITEYTNDEEGVARFLEEYFQLK